MLRQKDIKPKAHTTSSDFIFQASRSKWSNYLELDQKKILIVRSQQKDNISNEKLADISKALVIEGRVHKWKSLRRICLCCAGCNLLNDQGLSALFHQIQKNFKGLRHLGLDFSQADITDQGIKMIGLEISRYFNDLSTLEIYLPRCFKITGDGITAMGRQICRHLPNLKNFTLDISSCPLITDKTFESLAANMKKYLKLLSKLKLEFNLCPGLGDKSLAALGSKLGSLEHLQSLILEPTRCNSTDQGLLSLSFYLREKFSQLEHLKLRLDAQKLNNQNLKMLGQAINCHLHKLKQLCIHLPRTGRIMGIGALNLDLPNLEFFTSEITTLSTTLENFEFNSFPGMAGRSFEVLLNSFIQNFLNLKRLSLTFAFAEQVDNHIITILANGLSDRWARLESLTLSFAGCSKLNDESLQILAQGLNNRAPALLDLELFLSTCRNITDFGFEALFASAATMTRLQKFRIAFYGCMKISSNSWSFLASNVLRHTQNLRELFLNLSEISELLSDVNLEAIGYAIRNYLPNLEAISLYFGPNVGVTERGLERFFSCIAHQANRLLQLALCFDYCDFISDGTLLMISEKLRATDLGQLQDLKLSFQGCNRVNAGTKHQLRQKFGFIPMLSIR